MAAVRLGAASTTKNFKKSKFAVAKMRAGINDLDFESLSSDHPSDSFNATLNLQLREELDRFYEAQAIV